MLNFLRKKKVNSALGKAKREKGFLNYNSIKEVIILFNLEDWDEVQKIADNLKADGKHVVAMWTTARTKDKAGITLLPEVRVVDQSKDVSWSQSVAKPILDEFEQLQYDTLLDLSADSDNILEYLLAINNSKFCVGIRESESKVYDFVLLKKDDDGIFSTFEQMKFYLGKINS